MQDIVTRFILGGLAFPTEPAVGSVWYFGGAAGVTLGPFAPGTPATDAFVTYAGCEPAELAEHVARATAVGGIVVIAEVSPPGVPGLVSETLVVRRRSEVAYEVVE